MGLSRRRLLQVGAAAAVGAGDPLPGLAAASGRSGSFDRDLKALASDLRGRIVLPGDPGYAYAAWPNNARWADVHPRAIVMCASESDVRACITLARETGIPFAIRSGGHNYAGFSTTDGLLIDVKAMNGVTIDAKNGLVTAAAGTSNQDMADALRGTGFAVPSGRCPTVGTSGLVLGGGWGFAATKAGLTCDSLVSTAVVTADARTRVAQDGPGGTDDLFWAARGGGGGNFGVHTAFTFRLHEVSDVTTFNIVWPAERQVELMLALQAIQLGNPTTLSTRTKVAPARAGVPTRGDLKVQTYGLYWGSPAALREVMAPAFTLAAPGVAEITGMSYWAARDYLVTDDPLGMYDIRSRYVERGLSGEALETMLTWMTRWPGGSVRQDNMGILFAIGGKVKEKRPTDTAYVHRQADFIFEMETAWGAIDTPEVVARQLAWLAEYFEAMQRFVIPQSYVNFPSRDLPNWKLAYYGENLPRLCAVKRKYDPDNLFRFPQSIPLSDLSSAAE
ncbi:FAD-binding oxidoreductase [Methylobacterium sp. ID0610]|uniref:FAD-binding oxidoreductase n=1 Tax=Methylobacterium carpenticola TaxID=3344827 RepID=UPI003685C6B9